MKKLLGMILVGCMVLGNLNFAAAKSFTDLKSTNWAYSSVSSMCDKGIINGYPDGTFKPSNTVTYGEFIKMMIASMGYDLPMAEKGKHWAYNYYETATGLQLFPYPKIPTEMLDNEIPREMMAYLISQALGDIEIKYYDELKAEITDIKEGDEFIYPIVKAYSMGILNGYPDGSFKQKATLTRAETAKVLQNFVKVMNGEVIKDYQKEQTLELEKSDKAYVESFLQSTYTMSTGLKGTQYDYYGVDSADELKQVYPITYYSLLEPKGPLFSSIVTNIEELKSPYNDYKEKTYVYKNMSDIGIEKIEKTSNKNNCERIKVIPKYSNTENMQAVLIKGNKIVCNLNGIKENGYISYGVPFEYYNGAWQNTKLMDFDYIAFYEYTGAKTIFLIKKPF